MFDFTRKLGTVARNQANHLAVQFGGQLASYAELAGRLNTLVEELDCRGSLRVLILLPDGLVSYVLLLYLFLSKAVVVPVSLLSVTSFLVNLCKSVRPHLVVTNQILYKRHRSVLGDEICLLVGAKAARCGLSFNYEVTEGSRKARPARFHVPSDVSGIRVIFFTSGSTGTPKGVCLTEANILAAAKANVQILALTSSRRSLLTVPLYDYYGYIQIVKIVSHILSGSGFIFGGNPLFPDRFFNTINAEKVTDLVLVPHTVRRILRMLE